MSDTPRTDARVRRAIDNDQDPDVLEFFARELERDLNRVTNERDALLAERAISPWKPVSEPPKTSRNNVLAITMDETVYRAEYDSKHDEWCTWERCELIQPTHWMEIPDLVD